MLLESIIGRMSGKLGGFVASTGPGGQYLRAWSVPTNPNTTYQQTIRSALNQLASRWIATLTALQREAWETYAGNVTVPNRWGNPIQISGLAMYQRCNVGRVQWFGGAGIKDDAPTVFNLGEYTEPVCTMDNTSTVSIAFNVNDDWVGEDGAGLWLYASREQNASKEYFKGPYRMVDSALLGNSVTPPTSPQTKTVPFPVADSNRIFFFARVFRNDGRVSADWRGQDTPTFV